MAFMFRGPVDPANNYSQSAIRQPVSPVSIMDIVRSSGASGSYANGPQMRAPVTSPMANYEAIQQAGAQPFIMANQAIDTAKQIKDLFTKQPGAQLKPTETYANPNDYMQPTGMLGMLRDAENQIPVGQAPQGNLAPQGDPRDIYDSNIGGKALTRTRMPDNPDVQWLADWRNGLIGGGRGSW